MNDSKREEMLTKLASLPTIKALSLLYEWTKAGVVDSKFFKDAFTILRNKHDDSERLIPLEKSK